MFSKTYALSAAATLFLGTAAFGQTMVGGQDITAGSMPQVEAHCATLATGADPVGAENPDVAGAPVSGIAGNEHDDTPGNAPDSNNMGASETADAGSTLGNDGNADSVDIQDQVDAAGVTEQTEVDGNSGNADAEEMVGGVNLQMITLADCTAAGIGS